jgi:outer membrane protein insertion porin family
LGEACAMTGWRVHAWALMGNHYHLVIETPEPNLVDGMQWLQNTFTRRFNVWLGTMAAFQPAPRDGALPECHGMDLRGGGEWADAENLGRARFGGAQRPGGGPWTLFVCGGICPLDAPGWFPSYTPVFPEGSDSPRPAFFLLPMNLRTLAPVRALLGVLALSLSLLAFTPARSFAQAAPAPGAPMVRSIDVQFAGPAQLSREKVLANMRTRVGKPYSEVQVEEDIRNLYATGNVSNVRIFGEPSGEGVKVIVVIQAKATVGEVIINGANEVKVSRIRKEITVKPGEPLSEAALAQDRQKIQDYYSSKGFGNVDVRYDVVVDDKAGTARVTFNLNEGAKTIVRSVKFEGNSELTDRELRKVVKTAPKSLLNPLTLFSNANKVTGDQLDADAAALRNLYQSKGYVDAQVASPRVDQVNGKVDVTFTVKEGPQYRVGKMGFTGNQVFTGDEIVKETKLKSGDVFSPQALTADVNRIRDMYGARGYIDFNAGAQTSTGPNNTMDINYVMDEGVQSYVEHINVSGNTRTKDKVIRREIAVAPGDVYNTVRVDASKQRLMNLNYFSKVESYPTDTLIPGRKDLNVTVEEKRTGSFNFGAGFSSIDSLLGFVEVTQSNFDIARWPNLTGGGQRFRARAQYGTRRKDFILALTEPYFMDRELSLGGEIFYREASFVSSVYDERRYGFDLNARKRLGTFTSGTVGYRLENIGIFNIDDDVSQVIRDEEGDRLKSEINTGITYDTRDSVFLTRRGERISANVYVAGGFLGGDTDIYGWDIEATKYFSLPGDGILILNGEIANVETWSGGDRVPIFDRLYLGGSNNLRGFDFRDVGPKDEDGEPIGGKSLWRATVEYTFPVVEKIRGAVFYDVGAVSASAYDVGGTVNSDVGVGVRLDLPIGPIRIDYGIPITSDEFNDSSGKFNFGIKYDF